MEQPLTNEQLMVVIDVANGYRISDIADRRGYQERTIYRILRIAKKRAGAKSLPHLVSIVIASGLLEWSESGERTLNADGPTQGRPTYGGSSSMDSPPAAH